MLSSLSRTNETKKYSRDIIKIIYKQSFSSDNIEMDTTQTHSSMRAIIAGLLSRI